MWRSDAEEGTDCSVLLVREYENYLFGFSLFEKGVLPESGGWEEQEYHWIAAFKIIEPEVIAVKIEYMKKQQEAQQE